MRRDHRPSPVDPTPPAEQRLRIGIAFGVNSATQHDADLVEALAADPRCASVVLFTVPTRSVGPFSSPIQRRAAWASNAIAAAVVGIHHARDPIDALVGPLVELMPATNASLDDAVRHAGVDVLIDLRGFLTDLHHSLDHGRVLQIWCDGVPESLEFSSVVTRSVSRTLTLTEIRADWPAPRVIDESRQTSVGNSTFRDRQPLARRSIAYLMRSLSRPNAADVGVAWDERRELLPSGVHLLGSTIWASLQGATTRLARFRGRQPTWFTAYRPIRSTSLEDAYLDHAPGAVGHLEAFQILESPPGVLRADPFVFDRDGVDHVFFEEVGPRPPHGVIAWAVMRPDGSLSPPEVVLERPYHLSYPHVFLHDGEVFMIPESGANGTVDLYRASEFPRGWEHHRTLLSGVNAVDATVYHDGAIWWMFVNIGEYGSSTWDELFLFHAEALEGPWRAHPGNPVKRDVSSTRPAGALFRHHDLLIRPAQDCSTRYGGGIALCAIETLSTEAFRERVVARIPPSGVLPNLDGFHTLNRSSTLEVIDGVRSRASW